MTIFGDSLIESLGREGGRTAVIAPAGRCTFDELADSIHGWDRKLKSEGVGPGVVVGLEGDFSPAAIALLLALGRRAAIVVPSRRAAVAREARDAIAQVELSVRVDPDGSVGVAATGRSASHRLYEELRRRGRPGLVQFSSGTSGEPKAAVHDLTLLLEKFAVPRPGLSSIAFLLFDHMGGLNTMLHTLSNGATLVCLGDDRSPDSVCGLIAEHGVELLPATPTFLRLLLLSGAHRRHDLGSLKVLSYGGETMPATTLAALHQAFPRVSLRQTYGMIELGVMRSKSLDDTSLWVKVGGEGVRTRVVDGVLQVRTPSMLLGYLNATAPITADGWFVTGDLVERDGEYLRFLGRDSDLINVGGEKVYPVEVEEVIEAMEEVAEATVHGEPNGLVGEVVCARVRAREPGAADDLRRSVKRFCRDRLDRFKVPVRVEVLAADHPREEVKKVRREVGRRAPAPGR